MIDNFVVVLQGYSMSKEQMQEVVSYYIDNGINNIVVSSYSPCINDFVKKNAIVLENDIGNGKSENKCLSSYHKGKIHKGNGMDLIVRSSDEIIPEVRDHNINYQIYTSKIGVTYAHKNVNAEYALKCRADMIIYDLYY